MKKLLIIVCAIMAVASLTVFAACKTVKNNDPTPSTSTNSTQTASVNDSTSASQPTSTSTDPGQSTQTPEKTPHAAPAFAVVDGNVTFVSEESVQFKFKEDGGAWQEGSFATLDTTVGQHTVTAIAVADEEHLDSAEATFAYETKDTDVTLTKTSAYAGTVGYVGTKLQVKDGENFVDCTTYTYSVTESTTYVFNAVGGWAEDDKIFYAGDTERAISFLMPATQATVIEDAEGATDSILQEDWEAKYYSTAWEDTKASITAGKAYNNSACAVFNYWNNTNAYRFAKKYQAADGYNTISFDAKGDGISNLTLRLQDSVSGIYISYKTVLANGWYHYEIAMTDDGWKINYAGKDYAVTEIINTAGATMGIYDIYEVIPFCDTIQFIFKGDNAGKEAKAYIDNLGFDYNEQPATTVTQYLYAIGNYYVPTSSVQGMPTIYFKIAANGQTATVNTYGLEQNLTVETSVTVNASVVTLANAEGQLTITGNFEQNGTIVSITDVTGTYAQYIDKTIKYQAAADLHIDFAETPGSGAYNNAKWTQEKYEDGWKVTSGQMNNRTKDGKKVVNLVAGGSTLKYTYNKDGQALGLCNYFSVDLGNYYTPNKPIAYKAALVDVNGKVTYLAGSASEWSEYPVTTGLVTCSQYFETPINLQSFYFVLNYSSQNQYLYTTEYVATYAFEAPQQPAQPEPQVTEVFKLDFEDGAGSDKYVNSDWTQYKWDSDNSKYVAITGNQMNSRTNNNSKIVNLTSGYYTTYKFVYKETNTTSLGTANGLSIRVGQWYAGESAILKIRVAIYGENGEERYPYGTKSGWFDMPYTGSNTMKIETKTFDDINVTSFAIFVRYEANANNYLYLDDVTLTYTAPAQA